MVLRLQPIETVWLWGAASEGRRQCEVAFGTAHRRSNAAARPGGAFRRSNGRASSMERQRLPSILIIGGGASAHTIPLGRRKRAPVCAFFSVPCPFCPHQSIHSGGARPVGARRGVARSGARERGDTAQNEGEGRGGGVGSRGRGKAAAAAGGASAISKQAAGGIAGRVAHLDNCGCGAGGAAAGLSVAGGAKPSLSQIGVVIPPCCITTHDTPVCPPHHPTNQPASQRSVAALWRGVLGRGAWLSLSPSRRRSFVFCVIGGRGCRSCVGADGDVTTPTLGYTTLTQHTHSSPFPDITCT